MTRPAVDETAVLASWDNGAIATELTEDDTILAIAKDLKADEGDVRAVLVAYGRIEGE